MTEHFLASEIENGNPETSRFHIIPAPLEKTVSYGGGTGNGPEAILKASQQLEVLTHGRNPSQFGIHTQQPIDSVQASHEFLEALEKRAAYALQCGAKPVTIGGEHALSFAPIAACSKHSRERIGIIQFDAHADLRKAYQGDAYSHASVMQRATDELGLPLFQIGVRAVCEEEVHLRTQKGVGFLDAPELHRELRTTGTVDIVSRIHAMLPDTFPEKVYISFDVDVFDASFLPATGTPVPGGLFWPETIEILSAISNTFSIVGFDVVELAPIAMLPYCDFATSQLVYDIMGLICS
ncbi:MAG: agmatinase [Spirochaetota bacterium]